MADTPIITPVAAAVNAVQQKSAEPKNGTAPASPETEQAQVAPESDPRLEALARKERQLHKMRKEIESERTQLKAKLAEYETGYIPKQRLEEDPFGTLGELGMDYDKLTERLLNTPNMSDPAIRMLTQKIKAIEEKAAQATKQAQESEAAQYRDAIAQINKEVSTVVSTSDEYEMIRETGMQEAVVELIEQTHTNEGRLMDIEEACKQVEEHLLVEAEKFAGTKKLQSRLAAKAAVPATDPKSQQSPNQLKTLTNAVSTQSKTRLTSKERMERAIAAFQGKLT